MSKLLDSVGFRSINQDDWKAKPEFLDQWYRGDCLTTALGSRNKQTIGEAKRCEPHIGITNTQLLDGQPEDGTQRRWHAPPEGAQDGSAIRRQIQSFSPSSCTACNFSYHCQNLKANKISFIRWTNKQVVTHPDSRILFIDKKKWISNHKTIRQFQWLPLSARNQPEVTRQALWEYNMQS